MHEQQYYILQRRLLFQTCGCQLILVTGIMHALYIPSEAFSRQLPLTLQMILNAEYGIFLLPCSDRDD